MKYASVISAAALAFLSLSVHAGGAVVEVKPIELKPVEMAPVVSGKVTEPKAVTSGKVVTPGQVGTTKAVGIQGMDVNGATCSAEDLARQLTAGTSVSYANALACLQYFGSRISIGTCHADAGGLVSYNATARENFLVDCNKAMTELKSIGDYTPAQAKAAWDKALSENTKATVDSLKACNIMNPTYFN